MTRDKDARIAATSRAILTLQKATDTLRLKIGATDHAVLILEATQHALQLLTEELESTRNRDAALQAEKLMRPKEAGRN